MRGKSILLLFVLTVLLVACKKDEVPVQDDYYFTYKIKVSNRIEQPTIINGYYGYVLLYEGNFMPSTDGETKKPDSVRNELYFYEVSQLEKLQEAKFQKNGTDFYNLKKLNKAEVLPKFIVIPNKSGFYQLDTNKDEYLVLINVGKNRGYYNGGPLKVGHQLANDLRMMNMNIDYEATF